jgi:hypothetical protein
VANITTTTTTPTWLVAAAGGGGGGWGCVVVVAGCLAYGWRKCSRGDGKVAGIGGGGQIVAAGRREGGDDEAHPQHARLGCLQVRVCRGQTRPNAVRGKRRAHAAGTSVCVVVVAV